MRKLIAIALSLILATTALAATQSDRLTEVPVTLESARVTKFERAINARGVKYDTALVLRIVVARADYERLPFANVPLLYIGTHELRPMASDLYPDVAILTFHDPKWEELKGGEPMVLTVEHGAPIHEPERFADRPRFDPGVIE